MNDEPRINAYCYDCDTPLDGAEVVTHRCKEADLRKQTADVEFRWWLLALLAVAIAFWALVGLAARYLTKH